MPENLRGGIFLTHTVWQAATNFLLQHFYLFIVLIVTKRQEHVLRICIWLKATDHGEVLCESFLEKNGKESDCTNCLWGRI